MKIEVLPHLEALLAQEDTDGDRRITVHDRGPRCYRVGELEVRGVGPLSQLLQDLAWARECGQSWLELDPERLGAPTHVLLSDSIRERCWKGLTRRIDGKFLESVLSDSKMAGPGRLYLPQGDQRAQHYYRDFPFELVPSDFSPEWVASLNDRPGLLGLAVAEEPLPYAVPGGRFNEMYGWDSYFIALGLLQDGHQELARSMLEHQLYQIRHYGQVLNANRTYYLTRSQPPFLTAFVSAILEQGEVDASWLRGALATAMQEYATVWACPPRATPCGLSRYFDRGRGQPPETEPGHYDAVRESLNDEYFLHDRAVRESGHDTTYRLDGCCAHLCTVDLNSLLYRYEVDLADLLERHCEGVLPGHPPASLWRERARQRQRWLNELCWDESEGQFFDFDFTTGRRRNYQSATCLWTLWAGLATPKQAERLVEAVQPLVQKGGLAATSEVSRGPLSASRPARQWDFPFGWAPHQMLAWEGLHRYGIETDWCWRWMKMMTDNARDYNGVIPEKYDVQAATHQAFAEYGNEGTDFSYLTREGFGWTNASYQVGLKRLSWEQRRSLG